MNVRDKERFALWHRERGSDAAEKVMSVPQRGQRGDGVAEEDVLELRCGRRNTRVTYGGVAAPRHGQRVVGATDIE